MPESEPDLEETRNLLAAERRGRGLVAREKPEPGQVWRLKLSGDADSPAWEAAARWAGISGAAVTIRKGAANRLVITEDGRERVVDEPPDPGAAWLLPLDRAWRFVRPAGPDSPVLTAGECRAVDRRALELCGTPGICLMENAGIDSAILARDMLPASGSLVLVAAGGGNNGGDGLAVARGLAEIGFRVEVALLKEPELLTGDAGVNLRLLRDIPGVAIHDLHRGPENIRRLAEGAALIMDALLGTGFKGALSPAYAEAIAAINAAAAPTLSLDAPSGLDCDSGLAETLAVRADRTLSFAALKPGLLKGFGKETSGRLYLGDIGAPREAFADTG